MANSINPTEAEPTNISLVSPSLHQLVARPLIPRNVIYVIGGVVVPATLLYRRVAITAAGLLVLLVLLVSVAPIISMLLPLIVSTSQNGFFATPTGGSIGTNSDVSDDSNQEGVDENPSTPATVVPNRPTAEVISVTSGASRVRIQDVNLRAGPGSESQKIIVLRRGTSVQVLGQARRVENNLWVKVKARGMEGWVNQDYIFPVEEFSSDNRPRARVNGVEPDNLLVRALPSREGTVLGRLSEGAEVTLIESRDADGLTWWFVEIDALQGWSNANYLERLP